MMMHRRAPAAAALALAAAASAPTNAGAADRADCPRVLERSYSKHYAKVRHRHGTRAPGRNIREHGVLFRGVAFDATCGEIRRSRRQLGRLLTVPRYPTLVREPAAPAQPPAGVQSTTERAPYAPLAGIRACESGGSYSTNTGNGYYGAYQFDLQTWQSVGGSGLPSDASPAEQDYRAARLYAERGASPWPVCGQ
jgi:transglycosylase-like protein